MNTHASPRVLVIDDHPQMRQLFGRFLTLAGMAPIFASDGVDGLAAARAAAPDLVLCDIEMPRMDGVALCAALRADAATRGVPIVAITAGGGDSSMAAIAAGCDVVLPKPCSRELLLATIRKLLAAAASSRAAAAGAMTPPPPDEPR
jgi:CheY-like chemotaxis protein